MSDPIYTIVQFIQDRLLSLGSLAFLVVSIVYFWKGDHHHGQ